MAKRKPSPLELQEAELYALQNRLLQESVDIARSYIDPRGFLNDDGQQWLPLDYGRGKQASGFLTETELSYARDECRVLYERNPWAMSIKDNRINYAVGTGHKVQVLPIEKPEPGAKPDKDIAAAQKVIDDFIERERFYDFQAECRTRGDRDGEAIVRFFEQAGLVHLRFVEPICLSQPAGKDTATFGIETRPKDVETPVTYYIDEEPVEAFDIQHRKYNVDRNVKRGSPLIFGIRENLWRGAKLLKNANALAAVQSSIAMIRKIKGPAGSASNFAANNRIASGQDPHSGKSVGVEANRAGRIITVQGDAEYDYPAMSIDAAGMLGVLRGDLLAISSAVNMPEFMISGDASNGNYASILVSEGPSVKSFERIQSDHMAYDKPILLRVLRVAEVAKMLPAGTVDKITLSITPPALTARNRLDDAKENQILKGEGVLSVQSWSEELGLDYEQEQANRRAYADESGDLDIEAIPGAEFDQNGEPKPEAKPPKPKPKPKK